MHRKKLNASQLKEYLPIPALANWKAICIERDYKKKRKFEVVYLIMSRSRMFSDITKDYYFIEQNLNQKQVQCSNGPLILRLTSQTHRVTW